MPSEGVSIGLWPEHATRDREQVFVLLEHDVQIHLRLRKPSSEDQGKKAKRDETLGTRLKELTLDLQGNQREPV